jgi:hypothetical protein
VANALSRRNEGEEDQSAMISAPVFTLFDELRAETAAKESLQLIKEDVLAGRKGDEWKLVDGLVMVRGKVYVAADSPSLPAILTAAHGMGHEGIEKTLHLLRQDFFIPGAAAVKEHVQACVTCQRNKVEHLHPVGLLQPLEVLSTIWSHIAMDFIEGFSRVNGKSVILTVVDRFSKYAHFVPLGHP